MSEFEEDEGLSKLLARFGAEDEDPAGTSTEPAEEVAETPAEDGAETATEETAEEVAETFADDDHLVAIGEGEGLRKLSVRELKDLAAREDAIRARDDETRTALERATQEGEKAVTLLRSVLGEAQKEFAAFSELDKPGGWATARAKLNDDAFAQLQKDYLQARNKVLFLQQEGNGYLKQVGDHRAELHAKALKARDEALEKDTSISGGWSKAKSDVVAYAKEHGLPEGVVDTITHPAAISMMVKAMLYDRGAKKAAQTVKPVATSASKTTLKPGAKAPSGGATADKLNKARAALRSSGSLDDAEAAFMARFG